MKKRDNGKSSTDLFVCFPTRAHLTLMPKPICSPARTSSLDHHQNNKQIKMFITRNKSNNGGFKASPVLWARTKSNILGSEIVSEPSSPKVTCSGQIKIRPKTSSSKNWQSVMEEIERIHSHDHKKQRKKTNWVESLGFKKELVQFFTCLSTFRFDFRCFGSFPSAHLTTDDDDDDDHDDHRKNHDSDGDNDAGDEDRKEDDPRTVFSKWYMVLQDDQNTNHGVDETEEESKTERICVPPPNALLLMRCRSAPAKSWLEEKEEEEKEQEEDQEVKNVKEEFKKAKLKLRELFSEEEQKELKMKTENELLIMRYDTDFYKLSSDVAKETWVVGSGGGGGGDGGCVGGRDSFSRSLSWRR